MVDLSLRLARRMLDKKLVAPCLPVVAYYLKYRAGQRNEDRMYIQKWVIISPKTLIFPREINVFGEMVQSFILPTWGDLRRFGFSKLLASLELGPGSWELGAGSWECYSNCSVSECRC